MFLETVCIDNGVVKNEMYHRKRMQETLRTHGYSVPEFPDILSLIPQKMLSEKIKCSIIYSDTIKSIIFKKYISRVINSLKVVNADNLNYTYKYSDRTYLESYLQYRYDCDEILFVQGGRITDTTYSNVVFEKEGIFYTPDTYLLNGTKRQQLIVNGLIKEIPILLTDIYDFEKIYLINAMLDIDDHICLPSNNILL